MKYFKDHVTSSVFDNQEQLAATLKAIRKLSILENDEINPLTVRLFNIKEAFERVERCINTLTCMVRRPFPRVFIEQGYYAGSPPQPELYADVAPSGSNAYMSS